QRRHGPAAGGGNGSGRGERCAPISAEAELIFWQSEKRAVINSARGMRPWRLSKIAGMCAGETIIPIGSIGGAGGGLRAGVHALRSARTLSISPLLTMLTLGLLAGLIGGCESTGRLENGFFNPGDAGRFKKEPLIMPIVTTLDPSVEEPSDEFTQASDPRPED